MQVPVSFEVVHRARFAAPVHRQMHWVYAGFITLSIVAFSVLSIFNAGELTGGGPLAREICGYIAGWCMRLG